MCREVYLRLPEGSKHRSCVESVTAYLGGGQRAQLSAASAALREASDEERDPWDGYLLRVSYLSLAHVGRLAVAGVLRQYDTMFPSGYIDRLISDSPMLLPSQFEAISKHGLLTNQENLLIALPTGTGKTLLGELALLRSLGQRPGLVCYIAPYVALGRQVADKIARHTPRSVRVHRLVGGYQEPEPLDPENYSEVVVATPERFDAIVRLRSDLLSKIRCVVFDEAHMIGNGQRGIRLEGLLTRLRLADVRGHQVPRFILLSAVLANADALATWIGTSPEHVIRGTWQPSAKRLLRWTEDGMLRMHAGDDPLRSTPLEVLGETQLPWPNKHFYSSSNFGANRTQEPLALGNLAFLAEFEYSQYRQPVLCVCSTRPKTRHLADQIARRFAILEPAPKPIKAVTDLIDRKHQYLRPLREALKRGVAYHNSSLPHDVREGIERAVEERALKVVAATTTLAEGVDLPFRVTIVADWLMFDGERVRPMESLLFKNIAGRCGRAGQFTEGDTIIFDNPIGDPRLTAPYRRSVLQQGIFFPHSRPMLTSAIGRLPLQSAVAALGSQLLPAIRENPGVAELASSFYLRSFANQADEAGVVARRVGLAYDEILDDTDGRPLAVAASPVRLTKFGEAASSSGLSPSTARRLRQALGTLGDGQGGRSSLVTISAALLKSLGDVAEQSNPDLRKAVQRPRSVPVVRMNELEAVLSRWFSGEPIDDIFAQLPSNLRSSRRPTLQAWLQGVIEESTWTDHFAKFYDFMDNCIEFFLPWVLRSARGLAELDSLPDRPWNDWARFAELGVDSIWAVLLLEEGLVSERALARRVGKRLDDLPIVSEHTVGEVLFEEVGIGRTAAENVLELYGQWDN